MESPRAENPKSPEDNEVQARLSQIFTRASRLIEQAEFLFPEEAKISQYGEEPSRVKPNPSFGFFYEGKRYLLIFGRRYKQEASPDISKPLEVTKDIQRVSFGIYIGPLERIKLHLLKSPALPKNCSLVVKKMEDGSYEGVIEDNDIGRILDKEERNVNFANIPPEAAKLILEERIALLGQSPIGVKASPAGEMRMFALQK